MNFVIVNDIRQPIDTKVQGGPWLHHATINRGFKEYIIFRSIPTGKIYLEEVEQHMATLVLKQIEDDNEWSDLFMFARAAGLLDIMNQNLKVSPGPT